MSRFKGGRVGSVKKLQKSLDSGGGDRAYIQYIGQDEEKLVRFLTEPDEWFRYYEHYDPVLKFFPCTGDDCVGCDSEVEKTARASQRYLANVLVVDDNRVVPMKMAKDLANRVLNKFERYGTLLERDFILSRTGTGRDTAYDVDAEAPSEVDVESYDLLDLGQVLEDLLDYALGDDEDDEDEKPAPKKRAAKKSKPEPEPEEDDEEDEEEDEEPAPKPKRRAKKKPEPEPEEPEEDEDDDLDDDEEDIVLEEEDLYEMSLTDLKDLASRAGLEVPPKARKSTLIDLILDAAEEE